MGSKGGTNTTVSNNAPPQQFLDAYQNVNTQAQNVASVPYQPYPGQAVAQFSPDQTAAIQQIQGLTNNGGVQAPYLKQAAGLLDQSQAPLLTPEVLDYLRSAGGPGVTDAANAGMSGITSAAGTGATGITSAAGQGSSGITSAAGRGASDVTSAAGRGASDVTSATGQGTSGIMSAANLFTPQSVAQFEDPYTKAVVDATQAQFNNQNAQDIQRVRGNAASQGAFGGDREAVAEGITAGQQALAQAPVIAGLRSKGYETALQAAQAQAAQRLQGATSAGNLGLQGATTAGNLGLQGATTAGNLGLQGATSAGGLDVQGATAAGGLGLQGATSAGGLGLQGATSQAGLQNQTAAALLGANQGQAALAQQGAFGYGNLGSEALSTGLQGASARLQAGSIEQQLAQQNLNIPYQQWLAAQAYPFQTTGWLANIAEGLGGASGGTSSTTSPSPSAASQIGGLATGAAGLIGATGAFGSSGGGGGGGGGGSYIDSGAWDVAAARGGRIPRRAMGGMTSGGYDISAPESGMSAADDVDISIVPGANGLGVEPKTHGTQNILKNYGQTSTSKTTSGDSTLGTILKTAGTIAAGIYGGPAGAMAANALSSQVHFADGGEVSDEAEAAPPWYAPLVQEALANQMIASLGLDKVASGMRPAEGYASGGMAAPWYARSEAHNSVGRHGLLASPVAGRTDQLAINPESGSYVIPADVISGLGEGNTLAGANVMQRILETGPGGLKMPPSVRGKGPPAPPPAYRESGGMVPRFADGGTAENPAPPATGVVEPWIGHTGMADVDSYLQNTQANAYRKAPDHYVPPPAPAAPVTPAAPVITGPYAGLDPYYYELSRWGGGSGGADGGMASGGMVPRRDDGGAVDGDDRDVYNYVVDTQATDLKAAPAEDEIRYSPSMVAISDTGGGMRPASAGRVMDTGEPPASRQRFHEAKADPWLALAQAGFGMAAGRSPHALENIGAGALSGVQSYIQQKQAAEKENLGADLKQAQLDQNKAIWGDRLTAQGERTKVYADLAAAHKVAYLAQAEKATAQAAAAGSNEKFNYIGNDPDTGRPILQGSKGTMKLGDIPVGLTTNQQAQADSRATTAGQGQQRITLRAQQIQNTQEWREAQIKLRQQMGDNANSNAIMARATTLAAATMMPIGKAMDQVLAQQPRTRGVVPSLVTPQAPSPPPAAESGPPPVSSFFQ